MKNKILFLFLILCDFQISAQITFQKSITNPSGSQEGLSMCRTVDSGFVICGRASNHISILKLSSSGDIIWMRTFSGPENGEANDVIETSEGDILSTGYFSDSISNKNAFLFKLDGMGNLKWFKEYGGMNAEAGYSLCLLNDGGYLVAGTTQSLPNTNEHVYLIRTDSSGDVIWNKTFQFSSGEDGARSVTQTSDGGFIITGFTQGSILLMKSDSSGNISWAKKILNVKDLSVNMVRQTADGGYLVIGSIAYSVSGSNGLILRTDSAGNIIWAKYYHNLLDTYLSKLIIDDSGELIVCGRTTDPGSSYDYFLMKADSSGNIIWSKSYGGAGFQLATSLLQTQDGIIISGIDYSNSGILVIKTNLNGMSGCNEDTVTAIVDTLTMQSLVISATVSTLGTTINYTPVLSTTGNVNTLCLLNGIQSAENLSVELFPNPASEIVFIDYAVALKYVNIKMINSIGELVVDQSFYNSRHISIPTYNLQSGLYFMLITNEENITVKKIIIIH